MSYEAMARSHVKELVRAAFALEEVTVDGDGDLPFPCGTALFFAGVQDGGQLLRVWSRAVTGIRIRKPVLREINACNARLTFARVYAERAGVLVEGCLPVEGLRTRDVRLLCLEVGRTADRLGALLAAVHGGQVVFPGGTAAEQDTEPDR